MKKNLFYFIILWSCISGMAYDFEVDGITFEVGGRRKDKRQIEGLERAYIVKDDVEFVYRNEIPLWHFGFVY